MTATPDVPSATTPGQRLMPGGEEPPCRELRTGRWSTAGSFFLTGLVFATWAARIPARKAELGLSDAQLAWAFLGLNAGAILGLQLGAGVVTRAGSRRSLTVALPLFALLLLPLAYADSLATLSIALGVSAVANGVVDVAINDQGVGVQRGFGRSMLSGFHAMHSLGGVVGGGLAGLAAAVGLGVPAHFLIVAVVVAVVALLTSRRLRPPEQLHGDRPDRRRTVSPWSGWTARLVLLGTLAFVFTMAEGGALDWSAVLLRDSRDTTPAVAAVGLAVFQAAVTVGRLGGDQVIDRLGPVPVFAAGALVAGGGFAAGLLIGSAWAALVGLALLGLGLATLLPISISAAGSNSALGVPVAVARVSTLGYLGSFTGPVLIGAVSHATGLATALLLPAVAVALTAVAAGAVRTGPTAVQARPGG